MERLQKKAEVLNDLVHINKDCAEECEKMIGSGKHDCVSIRLITELGQLGRGCMFELRQCTDTAVIDPADAGEIKGEIYEQWQQMVIPFSSFHPGEVCSCCERKAWALKNSYITAIQKAKDLPGDVNRLLGFHLDRIYEVVFNMQKYKDELASSN